MVRLYIKGSLNLSNLKKEAKITEAARVQAPFLNKVTGLNF